LIGCRSFPFLVDETSRFFQQEMWCAPKAANVRNNVLQQHFELLTTPAQDSLEAGAATLIRRKKAVSVLSTKHPDQKLILFR
jgi:hypothetical protein